jgi:hypothetical protein
VTLQNANYFSHQTKKGFLLWQQVNNYQAQAYVVK